MSSPFGERRRGDGAGEGERSGRCMRKRGFDAGGRQAIIAKISRQRGRWAEGDGAFRNRDATVPSQDEYEGQEQQEVGGKGEHGVSSGGGRIGRPSDAGSWYRGEGTLPIPYGRLISLNGGVSGLEARRLCAGQGKSGREETLCVWVVGC